MAGTVVQRLGDESGDVDGAVAGLDAAGPEPFSTIATHVGQATTSYSITADACG